jgi:Type II secretion system (T2SS), protein E, N-terminal domain
VFDLLQLMYQDGLLSSTEMGSLQKLCSDLRERPVRVLRSLNLVSQPQLQNLVQEYYGVAKSTPELLVQLTPDHATFLPRDLALSCSCVGIGSDSRSVTVLVEDPSDPGLREKLEFFMEKRIEFVVATAAQLCEALEKVYGTAPEEQQLTTVLEASRGVVGGRVYDASQVAPDTRHDDFLVEQEAKIDTLRNLLANGLGDRILDINLDFDAPRRSRAVPRQELPMPEVDLGDVEDEPSPRSEKGMLVFEMESTETEDEFALETASQSLAQKLLAEDFEGTDVADVTEKSAELEESVELEESGESFALSKSCLSALPGLLFGVSKFSSREDMISHLNQRSEVTLLRFSLEGFEKVRVTETESGASRVVHSRTDLSLGSPLFPLRGILKQIFRANFADVESIAS